MSKEIQGGCACGSVRYALSSPPYDCGWCHCTLCRKVSGAPAMVFATVPVGDFRFLGDQSRVALFETSAFGRRQHCNLCGTPLTMQVDHQPETIDFTVATLDQPEQVEPGF